MQGCARQPDLVVHRGLQCRRRYRLEFQRGEGRHADRVAAVWAGFQPALLRRPDRGWQYHHDAGHRHRTQRHSADRCLVDAAPGAAPVTLAQGTEDTPHIISAATLLKGAGDIDTPLSSLSIAGVSIRSGGGLLHDNENGTWTYTPAADFNGAVVFNYTVSDGNRTAGSTASLTFANVNDAPHVAAGTVVSRSIDVPVGTGGGTDTLSPAVAALLKAPGLISGLGEPGFGTLALERGDDNSSGAIDFTSVFGSAGLNFFGTSYTSLFINNNGNVTFKAPSGTFTPSRSVPVPTIQSSPRSGRTSTRAASAGARFTTTSTPSMA